MRLAKEERCEEHIKISECKKETENFASGTKNSDLQRNPWQKNVRA
jgi:hypothetical protein